MAFPENLQQLVVGNDCWIKDNLDNFVMVCVPCTHLFIGRVFGYTALIAHSSAIDTVYLPKGSFCPPEAAHTEPHDLVVGREWRLDPIVSQHMMHVLFHLYSFVSALNRLFLSYKLDRS